MGNSQWQVVQCAALLGFATTLAAGCEGAVDVPLQVPTSLVAVMPIRFSGTVDSEVRPGPAVRVVDHKGNPVAGVAVVFENRDGGNNGVPVFTTVPSDPSGTAQLGTWKLGKIAGTHAMIARSDGLPMVAFSAIASPGPAAAIIPVGGNNQTGPSGYTLPRPVRVRVADSFGNSIEGITVTFSVETGDGTIAPSPTLTDVRGEAGALWKLGVPGVNSVNASAAGLAAVRFIADAGPPIPPVPARYELQYIGDYREFLSGEFLSSNVPSQIFLAADGTFTTYVYDIMGSGTYTLTGETIVLQYAPGFWELMVSEMGVYPLTGPVDRATESGQIAEGTFTLVRCWTDECYEVPWTYSRVP